MTENINALNFNENNPTSMKEIIKDENKVNYNFLPDGLLKRALENGSNEVRSLIINRLFHTQYNLDTKWNLVATEYNMFDNFLHAAFQRRSDIILEAEDTGYRYHIEFQSTPDDDLGIRVVLYEIFSGVDTRVGNRIKLPKSVVLYTISPVPENTYGQESVILELNDVYVNGAFNSYAEVEFVIESIDLLGYNLEEFTSSDLYLLSFIYFYRYMKDKRKLKSESNVYKILDELKRYRIWVINSNINPVDKDIITSSVDSFIDDFKNIISNGDLSEEVKNMINEAWKPITEIWKEEGKKEGREEQIYSTVINCYKQNIPIETTAVISGLTIEEVQSIFNRLKDKGLIIRGKEYG